MNPPDPAARSLTARQKWLLLALAFGFVAAGRLLLYFWMPERATDFDMLYRAAAELLAGRNPYSIPAETFPLPLPAVLLAVPFTYIPLGPARPVFDILIGWVFAFALWRHRGMHSLLALLSGAYLYALWQGQTTPLMVAAILIPALGFLLAIKPNTSAPLWIARPSWIALVGIIALAGLSLVIRPAWPREWWLALPGDYGAWLPPIMRPLGFILLLGALRWRLPEGRLLAAMALAPQTALPYELVPLALIPSTRPEMWIYVAGTWVAVAAAETLPLGGGLGDWSVSAWLLTLAAVYLPLLYLVFRRPREAPARVGRERRRAHRVPDEELKIDVFPAPAGAFRAKVTHLPSGKSVTESGKTRELAERKAQDRLAAELAGKGRKKEA